MTVRRLKIWLIVVKNQGVSFMKKDYVLLQEIVNSNLRDYGLDEIHFEKYEGTTYSIFAFPKSYLLNIENNKDFLYESYYKILDRIIDQASFVNLYQQLESGRVSRLTILKSLSDSKERAIKKTKLID